MGRKSREKKEKRNLSFVLRDWREKLKEHDGDTDTQVEVVEILLTTALKALLNGHGEKIDLPQQLTNREKIIHDNAVKAISLIFQSRIVLMGQTLRVIKDANIITNQDEQKKPKNPILFPSR